MFIRPPSESPETACWYQKPNIIKSYWNCECVAAPADWSLTICKLLISQSLILWDICITFHNLTDRIRILRQFWDEWALIMNARLMRGPSRQEDEQIWKKLQLSLPNLRKIFNIVKFRRAYILERSLFQTTKGRSAHYY